MKTLQILAPLLLALAVIMGAFGAHALEDYLTEERLATWQTAVFYHFVTALGLLVITNFSPSHFSSNEKAQVWRHRSAWCLLIGMAIFCDSLYALCLTDITWLGAITPIGGVFMIVGWVFLSIGFYKGLNT